MADPAIDGARRQAMAKANGYPSYEAMRLYQMQQQRAREGAVGPPQQPQRGIPSWDKFKNDAKLLHPMNVLTMITEKLKNATEGRPQE
jgi:hypothetical protein